MNKGLIIDKKEKYIIVMDDKAHYKRLNNKSHADIGQKIYFTDEDVYEHVFIRNPFIRHLLRVSLTFSLLLVLLVSNGLFTVDFAPVQSFDTSVVTVVTIDINPSVKLSLNNDGYVVEAKAINQDAKSLNLDYVIGFEIEAAVEWIVTEAHTKGYINTEDDIEDYVLVTAVDVDISDELDDDTDDATDEPNKGGNSDQLMARIEEKITSSSELQSVNVALIKATKVEMRKAEDKKVPVGLYVVKGEVVIDEKSMTVKEYFAEQENIDAFKNKGDIVSRSKGKDMKQTDDEATTAPTLLTTEPTTEAIKTTEVDNNGNNKGNGNNDNNGNNNYNDNKGNNGNKGNSGNGD